MNYGPLLFFGVLATLAASWLGLVAVPRHQLAPLDADLSTNSANSVVTYPPARSGQAVQGHAIYVAHGCVACHTQQVRAAKDGSDLARGWGRRRTVARDYLRDSPAQLGASRLGPDLANYGERLGTNAFNLVRLYNPRMAVTNSICEGVPFLFEQRPVGLTGPSPEALILPPDGGVEIIPSAAARQLAAYLTSLSSGGELPEAPLPAKEEGNR
jgi:cytochrome c oxidase cbb3-type subunit 2